MSAARTPGPWYAGTDMSVGLLTGQTHIIVLAGPEGRKRIATTLSKDDAAFIVTAVNVHDPLIEALRTIAEKPDEDNEWDAVDKLHACQAVARAALAKVQP